ncbi:sodium:solute symporter family protein [Candidatus Aminicenantes bacterium AC-334-K16]|jgi:SSS family solute:Na+ symporter|nr:sodium:solute symporter family protein [Candidatus Aminicenantes bacterium AC-334-K16]
MTPALVIILGFIVVASLLGIIAGSRVKMNLENWTVGGRRFGVIIIWLLMAGEIYTTFTFLGASGWAYSKGAPTFYILIYGTLAYTLSFFILPPLWRVGKKYGLHTQPDFFIHRYQSKSLGVLVAMIGVFSIIPYLQLQLTGLGLIVEVASQGAIKSHWAIFFAFILTSLFVYTSGIRGTAWVSVLKDIMMLAAVGIVGFGVPAIYFGGFGKMFRAILDQKPYHLIFPGSTSHMGVGWVMSTVLLTGLGFYMWPHVFGSVFSAKSDKVIKRNAIIMPLYQLPILLVIAVGLTAFLVLPDLKNGDLAFLALVEKTYPSWFLGFVGAAGAVTAMVPASVLVLFASTLLSKNVYQSIINPRASEEVVMRLSRLLLLVITGLALIFAIFFPNELVNLLILGYDGVCQFFPGVVFGLFWKRVKKESILAGLVAGIGVVMFLILSGHDPFLGLNAGFVGLIVNLAVTLLAVGLMGKRVAKDAPGDVS